MKLIYFTFILLFFFISCKKIKTKETISEECECAPPHVNAPIVPFILTDSSGNQILIPSNLEDSIKIEYFEEISVDSGYFLGNESFFLDGTSPDSNFIYMQYYLLQGISSYTNNYWIFRTPFGQSQKIYIRINALVNECCSYPYVDYLIEKGGDTIYNKHMAPFPQNISVKVY